MTNFTRTALINVIAGNPTNAGWTALEAQVKLIKDEVKELEDAIAARDIDKVRDGVGDVLFTTYGLGHRAGFDTDADYAEVVRTNMTKFDETEADALLTTQKYADMGVIVNTFVYDIPDESGETKRYYVTKSAFDQTVGGKKYPKGKWLKSHHFEEPTYAPLSVDTMTSLSEVSPVAQNVAEILSAAQSDTCTENS